MNVHMEPFERRAQQRQAALEKANETKRENEALRRALRRGKVDPYALIEGGVDEFEETVKRMKLRPLLDAVPGVGEVMVMAVLTAVGQSPKRRLGALTYDERGVLAQVLRGARNA